MYFFQQLGIAGLHVLVSDDIEIVRTRIEKCIELSRERL